MADEAACVKFDQHYFEHGCGEVAYGRSDEWLAFFVRAAEEIIHQLAPRTALDAGCASGLLVEALRDRGVDAWGLDISEHAISQVRADLRPYCSVDSITTPLTRRYDLITCIEVLEHLPNDQGEVAIANLCAHADNIIFSSTPDDFTEATHVNVQPAEYWVEMFARHGFKHDLTFDGSFIAPHAMKFTRFLEPPYRLVIDYERTLWLRTRENRALRDALNIGRHRSAELEATNRELEAQIAEIEPRVREAAAHARGVIEGEYAYRLAEAQGQLRDQAVEAERERAQLDRAHESEVAELSARAALERAELQHAHETALAELSARAANLEAALNGANWQLNWLESSRGVRMVKLARASRAVLRYKGPFALAKHVARWMLGKRGYYLRDLPMAGPGVIGTPVGMATGASAGGKRAVLFVSGCPGDAMRYRCVHQAEQLGFEGITTDIAIYGQVNLGQVLSQYCTYILHRVPHGPDVEWFINEAHKQQKLVLFDTDDLVFDPDAHKYVAALNDMSKSERDLYINGLYRYQRTMMACDGVIVSTEYLRDYARRFHDHVYVSPNAVSREMVQGAEEALYMQSRLAARRVRQHDTVVIGYFSGTLTHNADFLVAADALLWALEHYPEVAVKVVGHLSLDRRFDRFRQRVVRLALYPWQELPRIYTTVDINIAPLELNNPFTESKSSIKYLEAALCKVPTVASPRTDFRRTIEDGVTALMAETPEEWKAALARLIESPELRREIGERAFDQVRANYTTLASSGRLRHILNATSRELVSGRQTQSGRLSINWVLRAPLAGIGGGYRTIFRIANYLGRNGHAVRVYVEPIAHLEGWSAKRIRAFVDEHFGPLNCEVIVGHDHLAPADVSIATNWPTAYVVDKHRESLFKSYFIQDVESEFYDPTDPLFSEALRTYDLPLYHICIGANMGKTISNMTGRSTSTIDFGIDRNVFRMVRSPEDRQGPIKILFFARPSLKRRGFEAGIEALRQVKAARPDVEILLFGCSDEELGKVPFKATNLGVLTHEKYVDVLNRVHIQLSFSLSNISWVPFEGMACGAAVVEADVPSVRDMVPGEGTCILAAPKPQPVAEAILRLIDDGGLRCAVAAKGAESMLRLTWENSAKQFEDLLLHQCWARQDPSVRTGAPKVEAVLSNVGS